MLAIWLHHSDLVAAGIANMESPSTDNGRTPR
jgi:hypothetical protein